MRMMYPKNGRVILHVDMNSFYASVEMTYDPSLKGKPLAIAGNPKERKGIIITSSYEARAKGIRTTMPLWEAKKLCPELIVLRPNFPRYKQASLEIFRILAEYSDLVQPVSIDEGYVDITESYEKGTPLEIAATIQRRLKQELGLPCSIGVAPNKFLAKMASDMKKPMGITVLRKRDVPKRLWPLPVQEMHGVGKKTAEKLHAIGIQTIGDLAHANSLQLKHLLGVVGEKIQMHANGEDPSLVDPEASAEFKSIGNSTTLSEDLTDLMEIDSVLQKLSKSVSARLKNQGMVAWNIQITIRYANRKTITRSKKLPHAILQEQAIFQAATALFRKHWNNEPVRLLGVTALELEDKKRMNRQLDLFSYEKDAKEEPLADAIATLQKKYGDDVIQKGVEAPKAVHHIVNETGIQKDFLKNQVFLRPDKENNER